MAGLCDSGDGGASAEARRQEKERQANIASGMEQVNSIFSQFNPAFYQKRADAYTRFALPQLSRQLGQTQRSTFFSLADRGLQQGSAARKLASDLGYEADVQRRGVIDTGQGLAQQLQKDVEAQRSNVVAQLQASADPTTAAQQALSTASTFTAPSVFQPLGNLFSNFANLYANQQLGKAYGQTYVPQFGAQTALTPSAYSVTRK